MNKRLLVLLALVFGGVLFAHTPPAAAQTAERCFAETGFCISGPLRACWERNGGLPVFGYPLGPQREDLAEGRTIQVQWFERDRLEIQADGTITAGRLGASYLELTGRPWFFNEGGTAVPGCRLVPQTGYSVCGEILAYWTDETGYALALYLQHRRGKWGGALPLFRGMSSQNNGEAFTADAARAMVRRLARAAGIDLVAKAPFHSLRHAFAHDGLDEGIDRLHLQQLLGHRDGATTERYVREHPRQLRRIYDRYYRRRLQLRVRKRPMRKG